MWASQSDAFQDRFEDRGYAAACEWTFAVGAKWPTGVLRVAFFEPCVDAGAAESSLAAFLGAAADRLPHNMVTDGAYEVVDLDHGL